MLLSDRDTLCVFRRRRQQNKHSRKGSKSSLKDIAQESEQVCLIPVFINFFLVDHDPRFKNVAYTVLYGRPTSFSRLWQQN
jgi:hypothetical protein